MHTNSKNTPSADLSAIIEGLIKADIQFIIVGGLATVVQGSPVATMDVDIVHNRSSENISKTLKIGNDSLFLKKHFDNWRKNQVLMDSI